MNFNLEQLWEATGIAGTLLLALCLFLWPLGEQGYRYFERWAPLAVAFFLALLGILFAVAFAPHHP
jgi:hypothetical protein